MVKLQKYIELCSFFLMDLAFDHASRRLEKDHNSRKESARKKLEQRKIEQHKQRLLQKQYLEQVICISLRIISSY